MTEEMEIIEKTENGLAIKQNAIDAILIIEKKKKQLDTKYKEYKKELLAAMEEYGITKIDSDDMRVSYVSEAERESIDSEKLRKFFPEAASACTKTSPVKASVRIHVK